MASHSKVSLIMANHSKVWLILANIDRVPRDLDLAMISEAFHIFGVISHTLARIYDTLQIQNPR